MDYGWHTGIIRKILKQLRRWRQTFCKYKVIFCSFAKSRRKCKRMWTIMFISNLGRPVKTSPKWICCFYHFTAGWRSGNNLQSVLVIHTLKRFRKKFILDGIYFPIGTKNTKDLLVLLCLKFSRTFCFEVSSWKIISHTLFPDNI